MDDDYAGQADALVHKALGNWWNGDRRKWCAYCGIQMRLRTKKGEPIPPTKSTRDHVIPRKHNGGLVTIPACLACNTAKAALSLQEFLLTEHFRERRKHRHKNQWPMEQLWLVAAYAALKQSLALLEVGRQKKIAQGRARGRVAPSDPQKARQSA
jgi:hypothetical protein